MENIRRELAEVREKIQRLPIDKNKDILERIERIIGELLQVFYLH